MWCSQDDVARWPDRSVSQLSHKLTLSRKVARRTACKQHLELVVALHGIVIRHDKRHRKRVEGMGLGEERTTRAQRASQSTRRGVYRWRRSDVIRAKS